MSEGGQQAPQLTLAGNALYQNSDLVARARLAVLARDVVLSVLAPQETVAPGQR